MDHTQRCAISSFSDELHLNDIQDLVEKGLGANLRKCRSRICQNVADRNLPGEYRGVPCRTADYVAPRVCSKDVAMSPPRMLKMVAHNVCPSQTIAGGALAEATSRSGGTPAANSAGTPRCAANRDVTTPILPKIHRANALPACGAASDGVALPLQC